MQSLVEYAPAILVIAAAGIAAGGIIALFRTFGPRRKLSDEYRSPHEPTKWVLAWNRKPDPIRPDQLAVYTGTARLPKANELTVEAEIVDCSDENTRKLARR